MKSANKSLRMPLSTKRWRVGRTQEGWNHEGGVTTTNHHQLPPTTTIATTTTITTTTTTTTVSGPFFHPLPPFPSPSLLYLFYVLPVSLSRSHPPVLFTGACVHFYQLLRTPGVCAGGRVAVLRGTYVLTGVYIPENVVCR